MLKKFIPLLMVCALNTNSFSQTGVGIGFYPTGTEAGIGFRSGKNSLACLDARVSKAVFTPKAGTSSFITELNVLFRAVLLEKVRFHIGIGGRGEWNIDRPNKYGAVIPIGVEGFPFSFQNAGIFFEVAPYYTSDWVKDYNAGLRTVAGFVFYFPTKPKTQPD
ncbi:MAG TPA: hypothetical protein VN026_10555 [Bacteroidia bacterium]|nr:hypothetical protein [Bacteroidia bacterium]